MARLERLDLVQFRNYDDQRIAGLIELWAERGVTSLGPQNQILLNRPFSE